MPHKCQITPAKHMPDLSLQAETLIKARPSGSAAKHHADSRLGSAVGNARVASAKAPAQDQQRGELPGSAAHFAAADACASTPSTDGTQQEAVQAVEPPAGPSEPQDGTGTR
jgi:hypothetical protein